MTNEENAIIELIRVCVPAVLVIIDDGEETVGIASSHAKSKEPISLSVISNFERLHVQIDRYYNLMKNIRLPTKFSDSVDKDGNSVKIHTIAFDECVRTLAYALQILNNISIDLKDVPIKSSTIKSILDLSRDVDTPFIFGPGGES